MTHQYNFSELWIRSHHIPLYFRKSVFVYYIVHDKSLHCCSSDLFIYFLSSFFRRFLESRTCKAQTWWFNNWYILLPQCVTNLRRFLVVHMKFSSPFSVCLYMFFFNWGNVEWFMWWGAFCLFVCGVLALVIKGKKI